MRRTIVQVVLLLTAAMPAMAQVQQFQAPKAWQARVAAFKAEERPQAAPSAPLSTLRVEVARTSQLARMAAAAPVATTTTHFVQQVDVRLASILGGRIELGGYQSLRPMGNLLNGLPGSGSRPSWGISSRINPGAWTPSSQESFGLRLTVALGKPSEPGRTDAWRCLGWLVGAVRGCRL